MDQKGLYAILRKHKPKHTAKRLAWYEQLRIKHALARAKEPMNTSSAKAKGRALQNFVRDRIHRLSGLDVQDVRGTPMGVSGEDVWLSTRARTMFPITIECKSRAKIQVYQFYHQAEQNAQLGEPVVIIKQDRDKPLALVDAEYLLQLIYEANQH